jgi:hypothetical protein
MKNLLFLALEDFIKDELVTLTINYHSEINTPGYIEAYMDVVVDGRVETISAKGLTIESALNSVLSAAKSLILVKRNDKAFGCVC